MRDKIIERVRRLMMLADKDRNPSESEVFEALSKAKALMVEYDLSESDLDFSTDTHKKEWKFEKQVVPTRGDSNVKVWESFLSKGIARLTHTRVIRYTRYHSRGSYLQFEGEAIDVGLAVALFGIVSKEALRLSEEKFTDRTGRRSYLEGFALGVYQQANEKVKSLSAEQSNRYALVSTEKENWVSQNIGKTKLGTLKQSRVNGNAYSQGITDGKKTQTSYREKALT